MTNQEKKNFLENKQYYQVLPFYQHGEIVSYDPETELYNIKIYGTDESETSKVGTLYGYAFGEDLLLDNTTPANWVITTASGETNPNYLEKASLNDLDSPIGNPGTNNYTKYARDCRDWTAGAPGYTNFVNGVAWCGCFVDWVFIKTFDSHKAYMMLYMNSGTGEWSIYTPAMADKFKSNRAYHNVLTGYTPQTGDLVFFKVKSLNRIGHVGIVKSYSDNTLTTFEGNTTGLNGAVINEDTVTVSPKNQGVWEKTYRIDPKNGIISGTSAITIEGYGTPNWEIV